MPEPPYVKELNINYCKNITLLGITYDSTLSCMISNFDEGLRKLEIVANDWRHKCLTICGKITVVKTFMLSCLSHVATVLPTPPNSYCKKFEKIMSDFIKGEREQSETDNKIKLKASIVSQDVLFSQKKQWPRPTKSLHFLVSHKTWMAQRIRKRIILENTPY